MLLRRHARSSRDGRMTAQNIHCSNLGTRAPSALYLSSQTSTDSFAPILLSLSSQTPSLSSPPPRTLPSANLGDFDGSIKNEGRIHEGEGVIQHSSGFATEERGSTDSRRTSRRSGLIRRPSAAADPHCLGSSAVVASILRSSAVPSTPPLLRIPAAWGQCVVAPTAGFYRALQFHLLPVAAGHRRRGYTRHMPFLQSIWPEAGAFFRLI